MELFRKQRDKSRRLDRVLDELGSSDSPQMKSVKTAFALINNTNGSDDVDCCLCNENKPGTVKDKVAICETCHQDEVA